MGNLQHWLFFLAVVAAIPIPPTLAVALLIGIATSRAAWRRSALFGGFVGTGLAAIALLACAMAALSADPSYLPREPSPLRWSAPAALYCFFIGPTALAVSFAAGCGFGYLRFRLHKPSA